MQNAAKVEMAGRTGASCHFHTSPGVGQSSGDFVPKLVPGGWYLSMVKNGPVNVLISDFGPQRLGIYKNSLVVPSHGQGIS
jgi:hypothetical protein